VALFAAGTLFGPIKSILLCPQVMTYWSQPDWSEQHLSPNRRHRQRSSRPCPLVAHTVPLPHDPGVIPAIKSDSASRLKLVIA
jgi:hypothetical protein